MSLYEILNKAWLDEERAMVNSLIRIQTPFPERNEAEERAIRCASVALTPFKCLAGCGLVCCGAMTALNEGYVVRTIHEGTDVSVRSVDLVYRTRVPCFWEDILSREGSHSVHIQGFELGLCVGSERRVGEMDSRQVTSTVSGYQCVVAGANELIDAASSIF